MSQSPQGQQQTSSGFSQGMNNFPSSLMGMSPFANWQGQQGGGDAGNMWNYYNPSLTSPYLWGQYSKQPNLIQNAYSPNAFSQFPNFYGGQQFNPMGGWGMQGGQMSPFGGGGMGMGGGGGFNPYGIPFAGYGGNMGGAPPGAYGGFGGGSFPQSKAAQNPMLQMATTGDSQAQQQQLAGQLGDGRMLGGSAMQGGAIPAGSGAILGGGVMQGGALPAGDGRILGGGVMQGGAIPAGNGTNLGGSWLLPTLGGGAVPR